VAPLVDALAVGGVTAPAVGSFSNWLSDELPGVGLARPGTGKLEPVCIGAVVVVEGAVGRPGSTFTTISANCSGVTSRPRVSMGMSKCCPSTGG